MDERGKAIDLDIIGVSEGTDKSSSIVYGWDYLRHYQTFFAPWREQPINLIEIGVAGGHSLMVWKRYFKCAQIVGIDINSDCKRFSGDRVAIEVGSQEDPGFLHRVCAAYPPTIIIDDGSHRAHHIVYSFKCLFPMLQPGGLYIVEDLEFHFGQGADAYSGNKTVSATDYLVDLVRAKMANRRASSLGEVWGDDKYIRENVDSISVFGGGVAVAKRKSRDIGPALTYIDEYLKSADPKPDQLLRLAEYIQRHNGPLDYAERSVRVAARLGGFSPDATKNLVQILILQGRLEEAVQAAREATTLCPDDHRGWSWLANAERRRGRANDAILAYEKAISLDPTVASYHDQLSQLLQQKGDHHAALTAAKSAASLAPWLDAWNTRVMDLERKVAAQ